MALVTTSRENFRSTSIKAARITIYKDVWNKITSEQLCIMEYRKIDSGLSAELRFDTLSIVTWR